MYANDFHGRLEPFEVAPGNATAQTGNPGRAWVEFEHHGTIGGFAYLAAEVKRFREADGADRVLLLDAGDTFDDSYDITVTRVVEEAFADRDVISAPQLIGVRIIPPAEAHP